MLHELLSRNREAIIMRCAEKLRARHPDKTAEELLYTIPEFIDELIEVERRVAGQPAKTQLPDESTHARAYGERCFREGHEISELPLDFGAISDAIGELALEQAVALDPRSLLLLNECIEKAIAQAVAEYFNLSRVTEDLEIAEWVGSLGHELRNAIASALMAFSAIKTGKVGIESRTARVLERSLRRVESLVLQSLAAAQLRAGMELRRERLDLHELVEDIVACAVVERNVTVDVGIPMTMTVSADPRLLESALSNLILNAIKFTREHGRVEVRATRGAHGILIEVADECGGIGDKDLSQLFGAFERGERGRGVGLGLAITKQAIEAHGGRVLVRDRAPVGCVFTVWLPCVH